MFTAACSIMRGHDDLVDILNRKCVQETVHHDNIYG